MAMEVERFSYLFEKYYGRTHSEQELQEFLVMLSSQDDLSLLEKLVDSKFETFVYQENPFSKQAEEDMLNTILGKAKVVQLKPIKSLKSRKFIRYVQIAAVLLIISAVVFSIKYSSESAPKLTVFHNDIPAGAPGATLTLADGHVVQLNQVPSGKIISMSGISIEKSRNGLVTYRISGGAKAHAEMNKLTTRNGETFQVELPDGSKVWLNAASELGFSTDLHQQKRRIVQLRGEAYFEVSKDKVHPFIVETPGQRIEVLGTHFNVSSYPEDQGQRATLVEGSIKVSNTTGEQLLKPGYESFATSEGITAQAVDTQIATGWKDGKFVFEDQTISQIMKSIERWYNVEVVFTGEKPGDVFGGAVSRNDNVSHVLHILEATGRVHFQIEGRRIYVSK